jgi:hypothetical protein
VTVPSNSGVPGPADWSKLGRDGSAAPGGTSLPLSSAGSAPGRQGEADVTAVPGDPWVLQQLVDDFAGLRDVAWSVSQGSDAFLASALSGGFEGETAEALREVVSGRVKAFIFNIAWAFSLAGEAVAAYRAVLVRAQQAVADLLARAAGLAQGDARLAGLKGQAAEEQARVADAARVMEAALRDAAQMVSQPIKVPSLWERIRGKLELALGIVGGALSLLSSLVDGPVGLALAGVAFGASAGALGLTAVDYAEHRATWWMLVLAGLGMLAPGARGWFSMEAWGGALAAAKDAQVLSSPGRWAALAARGMASAPRAVVRGLVWLPTAVGRGVVALPSVVARAPGWFGEVWHSASVAVGRDFANVVKWYPGLVAGVGAHTGYVLVNAGRAGLALFTPLRFDEMAEFGFGGAWVALRQRASWSNAVAEFRAGWAGYGAQAGRAGVEEMLAMLHGMGDWRPPGGAGRVLPGPVVGWPVGGAGYGAFVPGRGGLWLPSAGRWEAAPAVDGWGEAAGTAGRGAGLADVWDSPVFPRTRAGFLAPTGPVLPADDLIVPGVPAAEASGAGREARRALELLAAGRGRRFAGPVVEPEPGGEMHITVGMVHTSVEHPEEDELPGVREGRLVGYELLLDHVRRTVDSGGERSEARRVVIDLTGTAPALGGLRAVVRRFGGEGVDFRPDWPVGLEGESAQVARFDIAAVSEELAGHGLAFVVTDMAEGHRYYFNAEGVQVLREVWVGAAQQTRGLGYLRFGALPSAGGVPGHPPEGALPRLVDLNGRPLNELSMGQAPEPGHLLLVPTAGFALPESHRLLRGSDGQPLLGGSHDRLLLGGSDGRLLLGGSGGRLLVRASDGRLVVGESFPWWWLPNQGTAPRLPLGSSDTYSLWVEGPDGVDRFARVSVGERGLTLTSVANDSPIDARVEFARDAAGRLTVRVPVSYAPEGIVFRFDPRGQLFAEEKPLRVPGDGEALGSGRYAAAASGLRVVMTRRADDTSRWSYELVGPSDIAGRFRIEPLTQEVEDNQLVQQILRSVDGGIFTVTDSSTGLRRYYRRLWKTMPVAWEMPLDAETGVRLVGSLNTSARLRVYDALGRQMEETRLKWADRGRVVVLWPSSAPQLVHPDVPLVETATWYAWNGPEMTARFQVPGVPLILRAGGTPESVMRVCRFAGDGRLLSEELPLSGTSAGEPHLASLRVVVAHPAGAVARSELHGEGAGRFDMDWEHADRHALTTGFMLTERMTGIRYVYGATAVLEYRDVLLGSGRYLRVAAGDGRDRDPQVVYRNRSRVWVRDRDWTRGVRVVSDAEPLTIQAPVPYALRETGARFRFDAEGMLVRQEWPLVRPEWPLAGPDPLRLVMMRETDDPLRWSHQLVGPPAVVRRFGIEPLPEQFLARGLGIGMLNGTPPGRAFAIIEHATGRRYYFGRTLIWELPLDEAGEIGLRLVGGPSGMPRVYNSFDGGVLHRWVKRLDSDRIAVLLEGAAAPLVVYVETGRVQSAAWYAWDESEVTVSFLVPGAPREAGGTSQDVRATAEYRFAGNRDLLREDLPLVGNDAGAAHLASLRVRREYPVGRPASVRLDGPGSERFRLERLRWDQFAITDQESDFRFLYGSGSSLVHWDAPLEEGRSLRVPMGGRAGDPHLVDGRGRPVSRLTRGQPLEREVPMPYASRGAAAVFRFDREGVLHRQEWPLAWYPSVRVVMDRSGDASRPGWRYELAVPSGAGVVWEWWRPAGDAETEAEDMLPPRWAFERTDASGVARRGWIDVPEWDFPLCALARDLGSYRVVVVTDQQLGARIFHAFDGRVLAREFPVHGRSDLRLVRHADGSEVVYNARGDRAGVAAGEVQVATRTGAEGSDEVLVFREVPFDLHGVEAFLHIDMRVDEQGREGVPRPLRVMDRNHNVPLEGWQAEWLDDQRVAVVPTAENPLAQGEWPPSPVVIDVRGVPLRSRGGTEGRSARR